MLDHDQVPSSTLRGRGLDCSDLAEAEWLKILPLDWTLLPNPKRWASHLAFGAGMREIQYLPASSFRMNKSLSLISLLVCSDDIARSHGWYDCGALEPNDNILVKKGFEIRAEGDGSFMGS